jgi:hypothetical protein
MFADHRLIPAPTHLELHPDRRPATGANEIRLRVKRALSRQEA